MTDRAVLDAPRSLDGRVALVAGGSGLIGRRVASALAERGASVAVHYLGGAARAEALAADLATAYGGRHIAVGADLIGAGAHATSEAEADRLVAAIEADLGPVDVLVNTVHRAHGPVQVASITAAELREQFDAVAAHVALCARVVPGMRAAGWGRVVYVAGALMARPHPGFGAYGAAKAAATVLTRVLALEEGRSGITANIVAPGRVVDPAAEVELDAAWQALSDRLLERTALGAFPTPDDVAAAIVALVEPGAAAITGQTVWVTGGEPIGA